jgi:hypothetical protein
MLTPEQQRYVDAIRRGLGPDSARLRAGVTDPILAKWFYQDRNQEFIDAYRDAKVSYEQELLDIMRESRDWRAAKELYAIEKAHKPLDVVSRAQAYDPAQIVREWVISHPEELEAILLEVRSILGKDGE